MKYLYIIFITIIILSACSQNQHADHNHAEESMDTHETHQESLHKTVSLNPAQFKNTDIKLGWFENKNISNVIKANGYTELDPQHEAESNIPLAGTINNVYVIEGEKVKKGQRLASMISLEYNEILMDKAKLEQDLSIAENNISYLRQEYERQRKLSENKVNARKAMELAKSKLNQEEIRISALKNQINILSSTINNIHTGNSGEIYVLAPIGGYITEVNIKIGSLTTPGQALFMIVDNSEMHADLMIYEKDLNNIEVGQKVRFILTNQSNQELTGEIYNIGKSFAKDTKTVAVHAEINGGENLIPGMYINALINIGEEESTTLPEEAIVLAEGRHFIFITDGVLHEDSDAHQHENHVEEAHSHDEADHNHSHDEHDEENHAENPHINFERIEIKKGASQLGSVVVTPLFDIPENHKIAISGAYYLQSHLQKSQGGGGHSH